MKSTALSALLTLLAVGLFAGCASSDPSTAAASTPEQVAKGSKVILDSSVWGTPLPWVKVAGLVQFYRSSGGTGSLHAGIGPGGAFEDVQVLRLNHSLVAGSQTALNSVPLSRITAKYGPPDATNQMIANGKTVTFHRYGRFAFGVEQGKSVCTLLMAPEQAWSTGIENYARAQAK
ncbi:MAG TPA: hypothetical protein VGO11_08885 [Chthoniobacteraceae bacterium]|jgi:hypothetical protein|nr:hypothetical protein [Chthoniobacteraceae bacterium]